ncbi:hypothetical protein LguiB_034140 [Lonicera macranthoides]
MIWNGSKPYWRSGPWNGQTFLGVPNMDPIYVNAFSLVDDNFRYTYANGSATYFFLNSEGNLKQMYWFKSRKYWEVAWSAVENECDVYGKCGPYGNCNSQDSPICSCLRGFVPKVLAEWQRGNWTSGCVRKTQLLCEHNITSGEEGKKDGFLRLTIMKVPDFAELPNTLERDCESHCLDNCSCIARANYPGIGCMEWHGSLVDMQKFSKTGGGADLYIRVANSELDKKINMNLFIAITAGIGSIAIAICSFFALKCLAKRKGTKRDELLSFKRGKSYQGFAHESTHRANMSQSKLEELPLYNFEMLKDATDNFHIANKLGEGGFGPVYKNSRIRSMRTPLEVKVPVSVGNWEIADLPTPKQPAFTRRESISVTEEIQEYCSNDVTVTVVEGRSGCSLSLHTSVERVCDDSSSSDLELCYCLDTITSTQSIKDPETLVSNDGNFKLGFFSPVNTTNRYLGVLYNISATTAVWVANRENPLNYPNGSLTISEDGNLVILDVQKQIIWSSNVSNPVANSSAQLLDTGNLVLRDNSNGRTIWESFEHASDSFLPRMRVGDQENKDQKNLLNSWRTPSDPSRGDFFAGVDSVYVPQIVVWNGSKLYWRSGPWTGQTFIGIPNMDSVYVNGFNLVDDNEGTVYFTFTYANGSSATYFLLSSEGNLMQKYWVESRKAWEVTWSAVKNKCDVYGKCGPYGSCNSQDSPICSCLRGFVPKVLEEWNRGNWTSGCVRRTQLLCERNSTSGKEDGFLRLTTMKVPDFAEWSNAPEGNCGSHCLDNCSCIARAYYPGVGCMQWHGSLIDVQKFSHGGGVDLYIRVANSELGKKRNMNLVIALTVIVGSIAIAICSFFTWKFMAKRKGDKIDELLRSKRGGSYQEFASESIPRANMSQSKLEELPLYNFESLKAATDNFHLANKLGEGGFGPVYKAWELWNEDKIVELIDQAVFDTRFQIEITRYINVGLLCVQEFANDRPIISTVLSMLSSEIAELAVPKQPAFTERQNAPNTESTTQQNQEGHTVNNITVTLVDGR